MALGEGGSEGQMAKTLNLVKMKNLVTGIGEALWDMLPEGRKIGGAPANFAYHVSQFGLEGRVASAVGRDDLGREILDTFREKGLKCLVETVPYPTGTVSVTLEGDGIPRYDIKEGAAWDNIPYTPALEALASESRAVCFGSLAQRGAVSRKTIGRFLDAMPDDALKIFDVNLRQNFYSRELLEDSFMKCNVLKINDEELEVVGGLLGLSGDGRGGAATDYAEDGAEERCRELRERFGIRMLILTCGVNGSHVFGPDGVSSLATPKVEVADTVGAGDSFTAAFVSGMLKGLDMAEAHRLAVEVSAYVCTQSGAMPLLPHSLVSMLR